MKHHFELFNSKYMAGCQQPFLVQNGWWQPVVSSHFWSKTASDNWLSAAVAYILFGCSDSPDPNKTDSRQQPVSGAHSLVLKHVFGTV